jgi:hypothetical protein
VETNLDFTIEIVGSGASEFLIYPFGKETNLPAFQNMILNMSFVDGNDLDGTIYGSFTRRDDGVYTIEMMDIYVGNVMLGSSSLTLPCTLKCKTTLSLE